MSPEEDFAKYEKMVELENRDKKQDQFRQMAWVSMISILAFTFLIFTPLIPEERVAALSDVITTFYIAQAGVIASFFGSSAYMSKNVS